MEELNIEEKCTLINLAMHITTGSVNYKAVLDAISEAPRDWLPVLKFWEEFNDMTRQAIDLLVLEQNYLEV